MRLRCMQIRPWNYFNSLYAFRWHNFTKQITVDVVLTRGIGFYQIFNFSAALRVFNSG
jgi:hypothetical protein